MGLHDIVKGVACSYSGIDLVLRGLQARAVKPDSWRPRDGRLQVSDREQILFGLQRIDEVGFTPFDGHLRSWLWGCGWEFEMGMDSRKYSADFKAEAVHLVMSSGESVAHVSGDRGINQATLGNWVLRWKQDHAGDAEEEPLTPASRTGGPDGGGA